MRFPPLTPIDDTAGQVAAPQRHRFTWMRWFTVGGLAIGTLLTASIPPAALGVAAMLALIGAYWGLVRWQYSQYGCAAARQRSEAADRGGRSARVLPLLYLVLSMLLIFALMVVPSLLGEVSLWFCVMCFVTINEASRYLRNPRALPIFVLLCVVLVTLAFLIVIPSGERLQQSFSLIPLFVGMVAAAAGGRYQWRQEEDHAARLVLLEELRRSRAELQRVNHELQVYAGTVEELAVANERNRLARELHDILGYTLATVVVKAEAAKRLLASDPARATSELDRVQEIARGGLAEVRRSVSGIRDAAQAPSVWHEVARRFVTDFGDQTRLAVTCAIDPLPTCHDPQVQVTLFRSIQEALTNVSRHAQASTVSVRLFTAGTKIELSIQDDGIGMGPGVPAGGYGLRGMRERVALLGGTMVLSSQAGCGTLVQISLPLHPPPDLDVDTPAESATADARSERDRAAQPGQGQGPRP